jgi:ectoine hydroxylase-related dioxygenase (phytanoyl-CoA dioxygenase family)
LKSFAVNTGFMPSTRGQKMGLLTQAQKDKFWHDGVLVVKDAVSPRQLAALRAEFQNWVEESQNHICDYGETLDGRKV